MDALAKGLAKAFLAGRWERKLLVQRAGRALGRRPPWLRALVDRLLATWPSAAPPIVILRRWIRDDPDFQQAVADDLEEDQSLAIVWLPRPAMLPVAGVPAGWSLPAITTAAALAAWLGVRHPELDWFADIQGRERHRPPGPVRHYRYAWIPKRHGVVRLLEAPKPRLKSLQRRVLRSILDRIPAHDAAHGFCAGRSIKSFALSHTGRNVVLRMDLKDFFPSICVARVVAIFITAGYPEAVARLLAGLCTNTAPLALWDDAPDAVQGRRGWPIQSLYGQPHLPQGAPTSPALANLCAFRLDCRLATLARHAGATYSRYADDLAFSGGADFSRCVRRFHVRVAAIAFEEGFRFHPRKTRIMHAGVRQQLAGVVVNQHTNVARLEYDRLKAIVCNCLRHGPNGQNRDGHHDFRAHLAGRIAHVVMLNPQRGQKLRALFEKINWSAGNPSPHD
jgi:hypothetical protein